MALSDRQIEVLEDVFIKNGLNLKDFYKYDNSGIIEYQYKLEETYRFRISPPSGLYFCTLCEVYCNPFTYMEHIYVGCNLFDEVLIKAAEWADVLKSNLAGKQYIHKIFISHSHKDKDIITEFVDRVLIHSCSIDVNKIAYTSLQSTGVGLGESIPKFIKENIEQATYVLLMISDNYKQSEVCLNEMGASWALNKKPISILLPNTHFSQLGWLNSLDKALKLDDKEALDKLYLTLNPNGNENLLEWNRQRDYLLELIK